MWPNLNQWEFENNITFTVYTATCRGTPMRDTGARIRSGTFLSEVRIFSFFVPNCKIFDKTFIARNGDIYKESFEVIKANICSAVFSNTSTPVEQSGKKSNYSKQNAISNSLDTLWTSGTVAESSKLILALDSIQSRI